MADFLYLRMHFSFVSACAVATLMLLAGCSQDRPAATTPATAPPPPPAEPAPAAAAPAAAAAVLTSADAVKATGHDTLRTAAGQVITVQPSDLATWQRTRPGSLPLWPDSVEATPLAQTGGRVQRTGRDLTLRAANGKTVVLRTDTTDSEDVIVYHYWGQLPSVHQWVVSVSLYEGQAVVLIDQRTGQRTDVWGRPVASPDGRYILASSSDLAAAFDPNGLQLFELGPKGPKLIWQRLLLHWGPAEVRWRPDGSVVVKQEFDPTGPEQPARYVTLQLPPTPRP